MNACRLIVAVLILAVLLVPALGFAGDDLSATPLGKHHASRLHHQPDRGWRTAPTTLPSPPSLPNVAPVARLGLLDTRLALPLLVRLPFVPPRG
jgi:hypothetical protein